MKETLYYGLADEGFFQINVFYEFMDSRRDVEFVGQERYEERNRQRVVTCNYYRIEPQGNVVWYRHTIDTYVRPHSMATVLRCGSSGDLSEVERIVKEEARKVKEEARKATAKVRNKRRA